MNEGQSRRRGAGEWMGRGQGSQIGMVPEGWGAGRTEMGCWVKSWG